MIFKFSDNNSRESLSHQFRMKRFLFFSSLLNKLHKPLQILDIGGTVQYWKMMNFQDPQIRILLLNLEKQEVEPGSIETMAGDATHLDMFGDQSVALIYSNSVIEHLFSYANQQKMADEVRRVGRNYFIQTPNYWFFMEPHWVFPFFQFLPESVRTWLTMNFSLGHIGRVESKEKAIEQVREIKLLSVKEMRALFPEATIYKEKFLFFTKSIVAYHFKEA